MRAGPDKGAGGFFPHGIGCTILRLERPMWTTLQKCNNAIPVPARCPAPFLTVPDGNGAASTFHSTAATLCNVSGNGIVAENSVFQDISIFTKLHRRQHSYLALSVGWPKPGNIKIPIPVQAWPPSPDQGKQPIYLSIAPSSCGLGEAHTLTSCSNAAMPPHCHITHPASY